MRPVRPTLGVKIMKKQIKAQTSVCGFVVVNGFFKWVPFRTHAQAIDDGAIRTVNTFKRDGHHWPRRWSVMRAAVV